MRDDVAAVVTEFEAVLRSPVSGSDDFFSLGGTSLLAVRVVAGVTARSGKLLTLVDLLRLRTPEAIAGHLPGAPEAPGRQSAGGERFERSPGAERFELAPPQRWYARVNAGPLQRNGVMAFTVPLPDGTRPAAVWAALDAMLDRHDALRTTIRTEDGRLVQLVPAPAARPRWADGGSRHQDWTATHEVPGGRAEVARAAADLRGECAGRGIPLDGGPLLRAILVRGTEPPAGPPAQLAVVAHHLVVDGSSVPVFSRELLAFLAGRGGDLPAAASYRAYTSWRLDRETPERVAAQRRWWAARLAGFAGGCHLPLRGERGRYAGYASIQLLPEPVREAVAAAARRHAVPVSAVRVAAYFLLCHALHGGRDAMVGMPVSLRDHPTLHGAIGMYANHTMLRHRLAERETVRELVLDVAAGLTDAVDHREHGLDRAMDLLPERCEPGRFPITGAIVNSGPADPADGLPPAEPRTEGQRRCGVADLQLFFVEAPDLVGVELLHRADVLDPAEGRRVLAGYLDLLTRLAEAGADTDADRLVEPLVSAAAAELRPVRAGAPEATDDG